MKKIFNLRLFLLTVSMIAFIGAKAGQYTYDFSANTNWVTTSKGSTNPSTGSSATLSTIYNKTTNDAFTVSGTAYFNSGYLMMKSGASLTLPSYSSEKITSIVVYNSAGCSSSVTVSVINSSSTTVCSAQTFSIASSTYTYTIPDKNQSDILALKVANSKNLQITKVVVNTTSTSTAMASTPTFSASATEFTSSLDVTITNNESGATVYYTTDGNDPTTSSSSFTGESTTITVSGATTTVKAMAVISGKENSLVASTTYTYLPTVNNIAAFKALDSGTKAVLNLTDAVVTYVNGSDHYIQDATGGLDLYGSMSYVVGNILNGSTTGTYTLYNGTPEVANGTYTGITATTGGSVTSQVVSISDLKGSNKADYACMKVTLQNVSYADGMLINEDGDSITLYDKSNILADYPWADKVNFTGVFSNYYTSSKTTPEVLPISVSDIEIIAGKAAPKNVWRFTVYKGSSTNIYPTFATNSDGTKNYKSSNAEAATIDASGNISLVQLGTTTISCYAAVSSTYKATQTASYELLVDLYALKDTIDFDGSALPTGWTKANGSYMSTTTRYYTEAPSLSLSGGTTAVTLTGHSYYKVQAISFYGNTTSAANGKKIALKYSTDSITWNVLDSIAITYNATDMQKYTISADDIAKISSLGNVYLQFYGGFNSAYLDDIIIAYTESPTVNKPVFSQTKTAVEEAFDLTITNPNTLEGTYAIYYTTDSSDPRTSATKQTYSAAIPVSANTTIKAVIAYTNADSETFNSNVATTTYTFLTGRGTFENPYTVADVIALDNSRTDSCWVSGVIVKGYAVAVSKTSTNGIVEQDTVASNIVLTADGTVSAINIPVKLAATPIRNYVNIKDNAANEGQTIKIYGQLDAYFSRPGVTTPVKVYINGYYYTNIWGDVNADLKRDINDVNALVDILVTGTDNTGGMSDVTGYDKQTTLKDLPRLIKYLIPSANATE